MRILIIFLVSFIFVITGLVINYLIGGEWSAVSFLTGWVSALAISEL